MLQEQFNWYIENQEELVKKYNGKVIVIKDKTVVGAYENEYEALVESEKQYQIGTFLIQKCSPGTEAYTQNFSSRVIFA
ncbi:MAG: hypothetical protein EZS26_003252 [Candidatus Ordinivivax streblomastigis]|uniref:DUF5678 domain-containing protein n=1 Tax=Candidatus Ordinivivax streblomastigis TaxID=2540710 RepID=A0A5M8NUQ2_9BACT|nr:MAG: hypothetical protein EZS26_003252 [Candidatus Ordinivivax streblomastigis]